MDILAAGGKAAHQTAWCNKITSAIFRVSRGAERVVLGDLYYGEYSQAIIFLCSDDGEWEVTVEPLDRFRALNPGWPGLWSEAEGDEPSLPLPALVE